MPMLRRETLASDGREIRYAPQWVADTDADLIKTAIGRVVLACALKHHTRRGQREPARWQCASQLVTHGLLRDAGFKLPPDVEAWDGISVEQAYDRLPEPQDDDGGGDGTAPPSAGDSADPSAPQSGGDHDDEADDPARGDDPQGEDAPGGGQDDDHRGDDAPGEDGETSAPSFDPSGTGEVMDAAARDDADAGTPTRAARCMTAPIACSFRVDRSARPSPISARTRGTSPGTESRRPLERSSMTVTP